MSKKKLTTEVIERPTHVIRDPETAGTIRVVKGHSVDISPFNEKGRVFFSARGDVQGALKAISENALVGSRDVLESIKACRSMIWVLKGGG